jgi:hypothetical protein
MLLTYAANLEMLAITGFEPGTAALHTVRQLSLFFHGSE